MTPDKMTDHDLLLSIHECLKGSDGQGGLCREFEEHKKQEKEYRKEYLAFRLAVIVSGALFFGSSGYACAKLTELLK